MRILRAKFETICSTCKCEKDPCSILRWNADKISNKKYQEKISNLIVVDCNKLKVSVELHMIFKDLFLKRKLNYT